MSPLSIFEKEKNASTRVEIKQKQTLTTIEQAKQRWRSAIISELNIAPEKIASLEAYIMQAAEASLVKESDPSNADLSALREKAMHELAVALHKETIEKIKVDLELRQPISTRINYLVTEFVITGEALNRAEAKYLATKTTSKDSQLLTYLKNDLQDKNERHKHVSQDLHHSDEVAMKNNCCRIC